MDQPAGLDYAAITKIQQQNWAAGDFSVVALLITPVSEAIVAAADPHPGQRVLDVACGSGNTAIVAARRFCEVTGVDYVPSLLERARRRAAAEGTQIRFLEGDAQALPFEDHSFDHVLSTFGAMFAPDQERAARELLRVCRPGGTIALANWTPEGAIGDFFRTVSAYANAPPGLKPPTRWGSEAGLRELFGDAVSYTLTRRIVSEYFLSVEHAVALLSTNFGPLVRTLAGLDIAAKNELLGKLGALFEKDNRATDGTVAADLEYMEALLTVR